jgi:hypothetical protein
MSAKLTLASAVLVVSLSLQVQAHDLYSQTVDEWGERCCDDKDCRPAFYRLTSSGVLMLVDGQWIEVPSDKIQYLALPGDTGETAGGHWCGLAVEPDVSTTRFLLMTRCAILPPQSASAQHHHAP